MSIMIGGGPSLSGAAALKNLLPPGALGLKNLGRFKPLFHRYQLSSSLASRMPNSMWVAA